MKTYDLRKTLVVVAVAGLALPMANVLAQGSTTTIEPATAGATGADLPVAVAKVLKLAQAKVADSTIIAYIKNSGNHYHLNVNEILYLRKHGLSDAVVTAMLNQPVLQSTVTIRPAAAAPAPAAPAATTTLPTPPPTVVSPPAPVYVPPSEPATPSAPAVVAPTPRYVPVAPAPTYYYPPAYYDQPYYDPNYYAAPPWYPPVSLS
ncbi:MAG: hypothetical protein HKL95_03925, partial [Phycisphaerae bacterium]|nr:hypothetical protein [Phycisphaerae bacterium]